MYANPNTALENARTITQCSRRARRYLDSRSDLTSADKVDALKALSNLTFGQRDPALHVVLGGAVSRGVVGNGMASPYGACAPFGVIVPYVQIRAVTV